MVDDRPRRGRERLLSQHDTLLRMAEAERYNAWLLERARPFLGHRVLDLGAGIGTFTDLLAPLCQLVVAVEAEVQFVRILRRRFEGRPNVRVEAVADGPAPGAPFDSIVCFNVLEHIADDYAALASFRSQLVPGGSLLLLVPAHPRLFGATDRMLGHERRYRRPELRRRLERAGFSVRVLRHVNPVGALGWLVSARLLRRREIPTRSLAVYDRGVPLIRSLDRLRLPFGLSLWAVAVNRGA